MKQCLRYSLSKPAAATDFWQIPLVPGPTNCQAKEGNVNSYFHSGPTKPTALTVIMGWQNWSNTARFASIPHSFAPQHWTWLQGTWNAFAGIKELPRSKVWQRWADRWGTAWICFLCNSYLGSHPKPSLAVLSLPNSTLNFCKMKSLLVTKGYTINFSWVWCMLDQNRGDD